MPQTICFHLDENCTKAIAWGLRRHGIDVTTTPEAGLLGATAPRNTAAPDPQNSQHNPPSWTRNPLMRTAEALTIRNSCAILIGGGV
jgi:hypothetical protein